ncbi:MAG: NADPH-dependent ferric siderophore reductase [Actinobacteria bacterium HGW-Actinobacteria-4]|nr:MAG: NADPH-dependent ferric siderophore reductase [Actinobacteria bacterium HGW-Actinobacteria-4]
MVRVILTGPELAAVPDLPFADTYVKLRFGDAVRAYTVRSRDHEANELAIDFVVHGDQGLAGPWAAAAKPGDAITFLSPGGDWAPRPDAQAHLLVGDEAAIPAIAAALERMPASAVVMAFVEVESAEHHVDLPVTDHTQVMWVHRDEHGGAYGPGLVKAVTEVPFPVGDVEAFVHGNADMVKPLRRYLLRERGMDRAHLSISGYWRTHHTDEDWRAIKRDFNAAMEADTA